MHIQVANSSKPWWLFLFIGWSSWLEPSIKRFGLSAYLHQNIRYCNMNINNNKRTNSKNAFSMITQTMRIRKQNWTTFFMRPGKMNKSASDMCVFGYFVILLLLVLPCIFLRIISKFGRMNLGHVAVKFAIFPFERTWNKTWNSS